MSEPQAQSGLMLKLGPIAVLIRPAFLIIPLFGALSGSLQQGAAWVGVVFFSVLAHELGHAFAMMAFGHRPWIELHGFGGATHWPIGARPGAGQRFLVTFAGPLTGLALGLTLFAMEAAGLRPAKASIAEYALTQAIWVNVVWSIINLLPVLPWDGGWVVDSGLELLTGNPMPRTVGVISMVFAVGVIGAAIFFKLFLLSYFGVMGVLAGYRRFQSAAQATPAEQAWKLVLGGQPAQGEMVAMERLRVASDPTERARLLEIIAWGRLHQRDVRGAKQVVAAMEGYSPSPELLARIAAAENDAAKVVALLEPLGLEGRLEPTALPLLTSALIAIEQPSRVVAVCLQLSRGGAQVSAAMQGAVQDASAKLFEAGQHAAALEICRHAFDQFGAPVHAFNAACCLARLGSIDEGLKWLGRAVDRGYSDLMVMEKDEDLAPLRQSPAFAGILRRAQARQRSV
jgi:Zn-dependent protease